MFSKYHGCGNDFLLSVYDETLDYSKIAYEYCNRYTGIGADGLICAKKLDNMYEMIFYNADGSRAPMCGNGIRCFCKFLYDNKLVLDSEYNVYTLSGIMKVKVTSFDPFMVCINLGKPIYSCNHLSIDSEKEVFLDEDILLDKIYNVSAIYMATHHLVTIVDNIDDVTEKMGEGLCKHPVFKKQINVNFVEVIDRENIRIKTYERGVGFTKACGTGGAASFAILYSKGIVDDKIKNHLEYGVLSYEKKGDEFLMTGPSELICDNIVLKKKI